MRYSVFAGGKRFRPCCASKRREFFRRMASVAVDAACALEFIHTYSLIHDDLPALDNDDLRRGKPTCHKKFGEAIAILAGDGLLTLAFETLARVPSIPQRRVQMIREIARAAGTRGRYGRRTSRRSRSRTQDNHAEKLAYIHRSKTAALIRASVVAGAIAGGAATKTKSSACGASAKISAGLFKSWTISSTSKNLPPRWVKRREKIKRNKKPRIRRCSALRNHTNLRKILPIALSPSSRRMATAPRACANLPNFWSAAAPINLFCIRPVSEMPRATKIEKERLDLLLVERGLAESRRKAQAMILAGEVRVNGQRRDKPGEQVPRDSQYRSRRSAALRKPRRIQARGRSRRISASISRAKFASTSVPAPAASRIACCSTAQRACFAVDVTPEQMAWKLQQDARVTRIHRNARELTPNDLPEQPQPRRD